MSSRPPTRRRAAAFGLALLLATAGTAPAALAEEPVTENLSFKVYRDGDEIGTHTVRFERDGDTILVDIDVALAVKVLFVTAFRYEQRRREVWENGRLVAFESRTDDDGTEHDIRGVVRDGVLRISGTTTGTAPLGIIPNSYWHRDMVRQTALLDTIDGKVLEVEIEDAGEEIVEGAGGRIAARRFVMRGERPRELWYDGRGKWVKMRLAGRDGSSVEWVLQ